MSGWSLTNRLVDVTVNPASGTLGPVTFNFDGQPIEPMHAAPWLDEPGASELPMLQNLQGDFFCAPFGANDLASSESRDHGLTANGRWHGLRHSRNLLELELEGPVCGARVRKEVWLREGQPVVYQFHHFEGGEGRLPLGHHAMLRAPEAECLELSFAPWEFAGTPPKPVEDDEDRGRSLLRYPQRLTELSEAETADGGHVNLTRFPSLDASEEIVMLVTDRDQPIGWSAAVAPESGWLWFGVRPNTVLRNTLLWLSNGGRYYPPFLGRHLRVLGLEEVTSYFHLGHRASTEPNELSRSGIATSVALHPNTATTSRYAFGAVTVPSGFRRVDSLRIDGESLVISDSSGRSMSIPFDANFLEDGKG